MNNEQKVIIDNYIEPQKSLSLMWLLSHSHYYNNKNLCSVLSNFSTIFKNYFSRQWVCFGYYEEGYHRFSWTVALRRTGLCIQQHWLVLLFNTWVFFTQMMHCFCGKECYLQSVFLLGIKTQSSFHANSSTITSCIYSLQSQKS